jgi:DNA modification methylase
VAAIKAKRNYIGYDINEEYIGLAGDRIKLARQDAVTSFDSDENEVLESEPTSIEK